MSFQGHVALGVVRLRLRRYDDAAACVAQAIQANPRFSVPYGLRPSALALAGPIEEAKVVAQCLLELEPTFRVRPFMDFSRFVQAETHEALALRIATGWAAGIGSGLRAPPEGRLPT